ncbi:peptidoglycan-associated lipoprotein Pal [bacterium]|nr:peptidoglycan-associated lipoprotein Pal [bacterium]
MFVAGCHKKSKALEPLPDVPSTDFSAPEPAEMKQTEDSGVIDMDALSRQFQSIFFDYNRFDIRDDQTPALQANANILRNNPVVSVTLEGHCDERGTEEYNLALGERRAKAVKDYLVSLGIAPERIQTISYGESRPFAFGHNEDSWQENRRAQSVVLKMQ